MLSQNRLALLAAYGKNTLMLHETAQLHKHLASPAVYGKNTWMPHETIQVQKDFPSYLHCCHKTVDLQIQNLQSHFS
jgi:hypothetical protein